MASTGSAPGAGAPKDGAGRDRVGSRRLNTVMHLGFFTVMAASAARLLVRHEWDAHTLASLELAGLVALLYAAGTLLWGSVRRAVLVGWFAALVVCWVALVWSAPSFGFAAIPLLFLALRLLPTAAAVGTAALLAAGTTGAWAMLTDVRDPSVFLVPAAVAGMVVATVVELRRESEGRRRTIDDLLRARDALAQSHRRTGVLEERERLAREIHDTVAQGLSSTGMLLGAADREWDGDPERARALVRQAAEGVRENLAEARSFVEGRGPAVLERDSLEEALGGLCSALSAGTGAAAEFRCEEGAGELPAPVRAALLRVAQGALANVREHAGAGRVVVTLERIGDRVVLDVIDDGAGFDPAAPVSGPGRGHGLASARARAEELGGELTVESAPGEGTGVSVWLPVGEDV